MFSSPTFCDSKSFFVLFQRCFINGSMIAVLGRQTRFMNGVCVCVGLYQRLWVGGYKGESLLYTYLKEEKTVSGTYNAIINKWDFVLKFCFIFYQLL